MIADSQCFNCCERKLYGLMDQFHIEESLRKDIIKKADDILSEKKEVSAPVLMSQLLSAMQEVIGTTDFYKEAKEKYNCLLLEKEDILWNKIQSSKDPFVAGMQLAITGNYIDFGALEDVNTEKLNELLKNSDQIKLDTEEISHLQNELQGSETLVYVMDNAGEIVLDKLFIRMIKELYPDLNIYAMVREVPVLNDATKEDAVFIGLEQYTKVVSNGCEVPGTPMEYISKEARELIHQADLCIAKGQGNFETMRDCGENIFYLFLCKCDMFVKKIRVERFSPMLTNEKRMEDAL